ncbi:hypothetical protein [Sulfitobacter aestuariivivens]|uniref:Uncharacterized protein n=1 Tax=Sulfitobacter aestuariivivens TaxID=2766981 RepID=A0A927HDT7_9RHOB|nr:hypothetical protein [Sulfitobacter aestuariivivens]MBD3662678.1 hypothetical protein [Sulfitobacter aestuariivivens]
MFDRQQKIEMTAEEFTVIEAALETQAKILTVQASAGGSGARRRLNEVKRVLARFSQQKAPEETQELRRGFGWIWRVRPSA